MTPSESWLAGAGSAPQSDTGMATRNAYPYLQFSGDPLDPDVPRGWFLPEDQFPEGFEPLAEDLTELDFGGSPKSGLFLARVLAAPLAFRLDWYVQAESGKTFCNTKDEADALLADMQAEAARKRKQLNNARVASRTRFLVFLKTIAALAAKMGYEDIPDAWYGPYILTVSGVKGIKLQRAFQDFEGRFSRPLTKAKGVEFPSYWFYVPIGAGEPTLASKNFKTKIVPPVLALPEKFDLNDMAAKLFVDKPVVVITEGEIDPVSLALRYLDEAQEWREAEINSTYGEPLTEKAKAQAREEGGEDDEPRRGGFRQPPAASRAPAPAVSAPRASARASRYDDDEIPF